jgi:hypothetical protein
LQRIGHFYFALTDFSAHLDFPRPPQHPRVSAQTPHPRASLLCRHVLSPWSTGRHQRPHLCEAPWWRPRNGKEIT